MVNFFAICVALVPWIILPIKGIGDMFRLPKALFFDFICMGLICFAISKGLRFTYKNKYLSWLAIWVFITIILNWYIPFVLIFNNRLTIGVFTIEPTLHFIFGLIASLIALSYFEKEDYIKIAQAICFSSVCVSAIGILQVLKFDIFGALAIYNLDNRFCAFLDNPNIAGNYLALSVPLFLNFKKFKYVLGLTIVIAGVIISRSISSLIITAFGLVVWLIVYFKNNKKILWSIISGLSGLGLLFILFMQKAIIFLKLDTGFDGRIDGWKLAIQRIRDNPIFGQGLGTAKSWAIETKASKWFLLHNSWLEIMASIGVVGLVLILLVVINSIRNFNSSRENKIGICYFASLISFLLLMCGSFALEIAPLVLTGLISIWAVEKL